MLFLGHALFYARFPPVGYKIKKGDDNVTLLIAIPTRDDASYSFLLSSFLGTFLFVLLQLLTQVLDLDTLVLDCR